MNARSAARQSFPRRDGGRVVQHSWPVDLDAALGLFRARSAARGRDAARLRREVQAMGAGFPRWVLTASVEQRRVACDACDSVLVFDRGLRCVSCGQQAAALPRGAELAWFGLLPPVGVDGLARVGAAVAASPPPGHVVGQRPGLGRYLLVPLVASYPASFPQRPLRVFYQPGLFAIAGMPAPRPSHAVHLLDRGEMCLFAPGDWRPELTLREVLEQRAYPHAIKLLNYADGKRTAFAIVS